ncbi:MAG: hypothetical protein JJU11_16745, partial [Candidatus Sumerlaeia bacterium]|nr:hypothetical protein [Candidatus Sumerlaeia bacterium]
MPPTTRSKALFPHYYCAIILAFCTSLVFAQQPATQSGMGAIVHDDGVAFRVWAPNATSVSVAGQFNNWSATQNRMASESGGYWSVNVPNARVNHEYKYVIRHGGNDHWRVDPYAKQVTNSVGNGIIADLDFDWEPTDYQMPGMNELVIYEMHVGTFNAPSGPPGRV